MPAFTGSTSVELHAGYVSVAEITVDAPASAVWPHVLDLGSWIYDFHFEHISGPKGAEGEVLHLWPVGAEGLSEVRARERKPDNAIVLKTLAVTPERMWYGINPPTDETGDIRSSGVNLVRLAETGGRTLVTAIRSKEAVCPTRESRDATQEEMTRYQPIAQARWTNKYLPRLKELSERRR